VSPGLDETSLRELVPAALGVLVRRGADFATAEDAIQDALLAALERWPSDPPRDPKAWLVTVAWRKFLDTVRSDAARRNREERLLAEPAAGPTEEADDTLRLYFLCAHPSLSASSAVALTLRAVGGLTTRQIAAAYLVPEATMAQRISRAKRTIASLDAGTFPAPVASLAQASSPVASLAQASSPVASLAQVQLVLYLVFNEGHSGDVDLAAEAIRLTRQLHHLTDDPEVDGLLALMLLHHARRDARTGADGGLIPLADQDRTRWRTDLITEGVDLLQAALARDDLGPYQAQAAIAALHADAHTVDETDWVQIVEWYDELLALTNSPVVRLNRAVAVGHADGPRAGLAALAEVDEAVPRHTAASAYLHERSGDLTAAAQLYLRAAARAPSVAERDHLTREAARLNQRLGGSR